MLSRSILNVPGHDLRKIQKALGSSADMIVLDIEDGVPLSCKDEARFNIRQTISLLAENNRPSVAIRFNSIQSNLFQRDLEVIDAKLIAKLDAIILPKIDSCHELAEYRSQIRDNFSKSYLCIESPKGLVNLPTICNEAKSAGLVFGCEDYCSSAEILRSTNRSELLYARSKIVNYAKCFDMEAIDMVAIDYKNMEVLKEETREAKRFGFTGKQVIHPGQIDTVNDVFTPEPEQIARAKKIVKCYKEFADKGKGAFDMDGIVIDLPILKQAERLLQRNSLIAERK